MQEEWRDVPTAEAYEVSNLGEVRSKRRDCRVMKQFKLGLYLGVNLYFNPKKRKLVYVHHLVAMAFLGHFPKRGWPTVINHIDGDRHNNRLDNLELVTIRENCQKGWKHRKSPYPGVRPLKVVDGVTVRWKAVCTHANKLRYLGSFDTAEQAYEVYCNFVAALKEEVQARTILDEKNS